jgi:hypothetical protein
MSQPIILDGGDLMITIKIPSSFTQGEPVTEVTPDGELSIFSVSLSPTNGPFLNIVSKNDKTGKKVTLPIEGGHWTIEIK